MEIIDTPAPTETADELAAAIEKLVHNKPWEVKIRHSPTNYARAVHSAGQDMGPWWSVEIKNYGGVVVCSTPRMLTFTAALGYIVEELKKHKGAT